MQNKKRSRKTRDLERDTRGAHTAVSPAVGVPDRMRVRLRYPFQTLLSSAVASRASVRYSSNGAYDPDPAVGSTSTPYFNEWTNMYLYYRVLSYKVTFSVSSLEVVPLTVYVVNSNTDPGSGGVNFLDYANGPHGKQFQIAGINGGRGGTTRVSFSIRQIAGSQDVLTSDQYRGTSSSNPSDQTWFAIGLQNSTGSLTNGAWISGHIEYLVDFYDRSLVGTYFRPPPYTHQEMIDANVEKQRSESQGKIPDPKALQKIAEYLTWKKEREAYFASLKQ